MAVSTDERLTQIISERLHSLSGNSFDESLIADLANKKVVMLGEATHGTAEFYAIRRRITEALVRDHGFRIVALEADWPEAQLFNHFVRNPSERTSEEVLHQPRRWPTWMWANTEWSRQLDMLRAFNETNPKRKAGVYGLDLYSLFESIDSILKTIRQTDTRLADELAKKYECFESFERSEREYARSLQAIPEGCTRQVMQNLRTLLGLRLDKIKMDEEALFDVQQNARIVKEAEQYYRAMLDDSENSWNIRDRHMIDTLESLLRHEGPEGKAIVWAHNTHIGDYRATTMVDHGYVNLGGLARERFGDENVALMGFSTHRGSVIASFQWEGRAMEMDVPPARDDSYDAIFQKAAERRKLSSFYLPLRQHHKDFDVFPKRGQRAIGVVYDPYHERLGNYVPTQLEQRYDGIVFVSETKAVKSIRVPERHDQPPEMWPSGV